MRVDITNGKIKGWMKVSEAAAVCEVTTSKMRQLAKERIGDKDKFELYGTKFLRESKVKKLAKSL